MASRRSKRRSWTTAICAAIQVALLEEPPPGVKSKSRRAAPVVGTLSCPKSGHDAAYAFLHKACGLAGRRFQHCPATEFGWPKVISTMYQIRRFSA